MPKVGMEPIRREQIRRAAAKVISKRGFDRTTLADVAKAAKVSTGMINHYYKNKIALLVDTLLYVSEWFQTAIRAEVEAETTGEGKLRALTRIGPFDTKGMPYVGSRIWAWAMAESMQSKELRQVIQERRRLFEEMIAEVLAFIRPDIDPQHAKALAAELDAYVNGLCIHTVTGAENLDKASVERSFLQAVAAGLGLAVRDGQLVRRSGENSTAATAMRDRRKRAVAH
ncbi:TetR family transcriptional regulator [Rhodoligotrophos defluvii]|uniref:TetR family transcriptional regulator n=1 Tax=Rhodoligotrophos defluvii TaxID=2561934 RepID=UPI0014853601|nr:TetR family transcriptional regulator [Rhodoligotrophos defluvii]